MLTFSFSNQERRAVIDAYRTKRDEAKEYKQTYERCYRLITVKSRMLNFIIPTSSLFFFRQASQTINK